jgi:hypothetical protein
VIFFLAYASCWRIVGIVNTHTNTMGAGNTTAAQQVIYTAANGWQVRRVFYALRNNRLVPSACGTRIWHEVFDAKGKEFVSYEDGNAPMTHLQKIADTAGAAL